MKRPQILLIGNSINRAFHSDSWNELLNSVNRRSDRYDAEELRCPETLKAILVTGDNVDKALKSKKSELADLGTDKPPEQLALLQRLLGIGFDGILTTNYSYELETAALGADKISESVLKRCQRHTNEIKRCEANFMLHTYNSVIYNGAEQRIWHIHGEARKPDSMILGHYYYGTLLGKILDINKKRGSSYYNMQKNSGEQHSIGAWTDAFILGDLYILGFGFGFAEIEMWWLLNRKKRERARVGKTYFYELNPPGKNNAEKLDLLELMKAKTVVLDVEDNDWKGAYSRAIDDIAGKVRKNKNADRDSKK